MDLQDSDGPILYSGTAFVRSRRPWASWVNWNAHLGGGPRLIVRPKAIEISASQGMMLSSRTVLIDASKATMHVERIGWAGLPIRRRECIRIKTGEKRVRGWIEMAVSPSEGTAAAWKALCDAGVVPSQPPTDSN